MSSIRVVQKTQMIVVNPATQTVTVINAGPQGPPGEDGGGTPSYDHTQSVADSSWVINHNLGFYPNIQSFDDLGIEFDPTIIHHSINQVELQLLSPRAGVAHLS